MRRLRPQFAVFRAHGWLSERQQPLDPLPQGQRIPIIKYLKIIFIPRHYVVLIERA
jgi:hypothetical protein